MPQSGRYKECSRSLREPAGATQRFDRESSLPRPFLAQLNKTADQARQHQEMPFDRLVLELNPEKDMSRTALFDVLFQFEAEPPVVLEMGGVKARAIDTNLGYGKYDLALSLQGAADGLSGTVAYNADIYDDFMIEQLMRHYEAILEAVTSDPDQRVGDVRLLSQAEEQQQLVTWNATQAWYPRERQSIGFLRSK